MPTINDIRNIALVGHGNSGKTTIGEAILFKAKVTSRQGKPSEKSSHLDHLDDEKEKGYSITAALGRMDWKKTTINMIDTPGKPDFIGEVYAAAPVVETAVVVVAANAGVQVNTRNCWKIAEQNKCARAIVITKVDAENVRIEDVLKQVLDTFGDRCVPLNYPKGEGHSFESIHSVIDLADGAPDECATWRETLVERAVEADEDVMAEFLETMEIEPDKLKVVLRKAVAGGQVVPVMFVSEPKDKGYEEFLDIVAAYFPSPADLPLRQPVYDADAYGKYEDALIAAAGHHDEEAEAETEEGGEAHKATVIEPPPTVKVPDGFLAQVFRTVIDTHVGRLSFVRVWGGEMASDATMYVPRTGKHEKCTGFNVVTAGADRKKVDKATAGDIVMLVKMEGLRTHYTITDNAKVRIGKPKFPVPMVAKAIFPKTQKDVDRLGDALRRMTDEDPCFTDRTDKVTKERVIAGMSDLHLNIMLERMKHRYKVEVDHQTPKVPYHETCTGTAKGVYRHKKQSGGSGEFAEVHIEISPTERGEGFVFEDAIVGGAIDRPYIPAVEKGIRDCCQDGVLAGFPVVDVRAKLYDGKQHPVDSKDRAFQKAGREAFKEIFPKCKPKLMEPYMTMDVTVPTDTVGDILADLSSRCRGRVLEQSSEGNFTTLRAHVPQAEVQTYSQTLQSVTGGEGYYTLEFSHYDVCPDGIAQQVIAKYKKEAKDDDK
ncbi:MAG: elongation factor G [Planctomycetota bacterium]